MEAPTRRGPQLLVRPKEVQNGWIAMADSYQPLLNAEVVVANAEAIEFTWNTKQCKGNELHFAALQGDLQEVIKILSKRDDEKATKTLQKAPKAAEICNSRFTFPMLASEKDGMGGEGKLSQLQLVEGTGQAIHLAASRGHLEVVKDTQLVFRRKAITVHLVGPESSLNPAGNQPRWYVFMVTSSSFWPNNLIHLKGIW